MNLIEVENEVKAISGVKELYHRAEDFRSFDVKGKPISGSGKVQIYSMWQEVNGVIKNHRIDVLVLNKGTAEETAIPFVPLAQFSPVSTPFLDELSSKIPAYQAAHSEIEKVIINSCDENTHIAMVTTYEYDGSVTNECKKIVYKVADKITIRNYNPIKGE